MPSPETPDMALPPGAFLEIVIDSKGNLVLETKGTTGMQCDLLSGALETSLGMVVGRTNKQAYYEDGQ